MEYDKEHKNVMLKLYLKPDSLNDLFPNCKMHEQILHL